MSWGRVDDGWWCHPKVVPLSLHARGLWVTALSWSCAQRTDEVPEVMLPLFQGSKGEANELVARGMWVEVDGGWRIHDWEKYQVWSLSERRAEAGRKGGKASGEARRAEASTKQTEATAEAGPHHTTPHQEKTSDDGVVERFATEVWEPYPRRNGKKVGRKAALAKYRRLSDKQRTDVAQAVKRYAAACNAGKTIARDCERFLANDWWQDWLAADGASPEGMRLVNGVWRQT